MTSSLTGCPLLCLVQKAAQAESLFITTLCTDKAQWLQMEQLDIHINALIL